MPEEPDGPDLPPQPVPPGSVQPAFRQPGRSQPVPPGQPPCPGISRPAAAARGPGVRRAAGGVRPPRP